jgi:hypothetical protein
MSKELELLRQRIERLLPEVGDYRQRLLHCLEVAPRPEDALALIRSVAESLVKQLMLDLKLKQEAMLDACLRKLEEPAVMNQGLVPAEIISPLHTIRVLGNKGAHGALKIKARVGHVDSMLGLMLEILEWYFTEFAKGPQQASIFEPETQEPALPELASGPVELLQLDEECMEALGQAVTDGPLMAVFRAGRSATPIAVPLPDGRKLRLRLSEEAVPDEEFWDLQSWVRILTRKRESVRLLDEEIAQGGLGTRAPAYRIERAQDKEAAEEARQKVAAYLERFIESSVIVGE